MRSISTPVPSTSFYTDTVVSLLTGGKYITVIYPSKKGRRSLVVSNELGGVYDPNLLARWFRGFCVKNGFGTFGDMEEYTDAAGRKRTRKADYRRLKFHEGAADNPWNTLCQGGLR